MKNLTAFANKSFAITSFARTAFLQTPSLRTPLLQTLLMITLLVQTAFCANWSGIISPTRAADWSGAGVVGGIPSASWPNCVTAACNTLFGGNVTAATIQSALQSAPANSV